MKSIFPLKRIHVMKTTGLELISRANLLINVKNDVGKTKTATFTFTQPINGALFILHVTGNVPRVLQDQHTKNQVFQV